MTALPPEDRPFGRPEPVDPSALAGPRPTGRGPASPADDVLELLASVIAFQASLECHELRRPARGHPWLMRRWRREHEVLLLQRQMLRLRVEALPLVAFAPFPRPCV